MNFVSQKDSMFQYHLNLGVDMSNIIVDVVSARRGSGSYLDTPPALDIMRLRREESTFLSEFTKCCSNVGAEIVP